MPSTCSSNRARPAQSRSLPSITVFTHPAARLIKTVPQLQPPIRVNAHVPIDTLGIGRTSPTDVVLTDVVGPLSLLVVPDPLDPTIATLVLSIGFEDAALQGAARRFVLPFRSFQRDPISGQLVPRSQITGFDAADRKLYPGLGAGLKGLDGGSFWFFEDVGESGALDRYRWEKDNLGRRAIWTVWLFSTPAPVVMHLQNLLHSYPAPVGPLPKWLKERNGYPWKDSYLQHTLPPPASSQDSQPQSRSTILAESAQSDTSTGQPLPRSPHPSGPQRLSAGNAQSIAFLSAQIHGSVSPTSVDRPLNLASMDLAPASSLSTRSEHLTDGSPFSHDDAPGVVFRTPRSAAVPSEYRNSLVAVDNLTGQIISVLASHVDLDASPPPRHDQASTNSSDDFEAEDEAKTPLDEHANHHALGLEPQSKLLPQVPSERHASVEPINPAVSRAGTNDCTDTNNPSRPSSMLAIDTFSPPPLPPKQSNPRNPRASQVPSHRNSTASAAFFTAESDAETMSSYDSDAPEIDVRTITRDNLPASFTSISNKASANQVEPHRPELLRDPADDDGGNASDASGSTVGGPAVRMWRKARGKSKNKPAKSSSAQSRRPVKSRPASQLSDRTSKAETAFEALSDGDTADDEGFDQVQTPMPKDCTGPSKSADKHPPPRTEHKKGSQNHLPRSAMRTDQVRAIEDRIWREALEGDQLPIDAPYTHLAARGDADAYPSSILSSPRFITDGSAIELVSVDDNVRKRERKQRQRAQRAEQANYMQGGTVLIEFLAGSSRIGASLIRTAGLDAEAHEIVPTSRASTAGEAAFNVLGYVPLLPQHLLSFLGLSSSSQQAGVASDTHAVAASSSTSYLPSLGLPALPDWVSNLFSFGATRSCAAEDAAAEPAGDASRAEEWEYAIPEFDPNSLSSTPRPVYRRKRPVPSAMSGFSISPSAPISASENTEASQKATQSATAQLRPMADPKQITTNNHRYSVLHFDSLGVGRRAFLRRMPGVNGAAL